MFDKAFQLAIMIFSSLMIAQLFSRILFEKEFYRKVNFLLIFLASTLLMYKIEPRPFELAFSLITPPFRLEYLMTFTLAFTPFLIPLAVLLSRGETWLLSETVVRFLKRRRFRTVLNVTTIALVLSVLTSVAAISPLTSFYAIKIAQTPAELKELCKHYYIYIVFYKEYIWIASTETSIQKEEIKPLTLEVKTGFLSLFSKPKAVVDFIYTEGLADGKRVQILITDIDALQEIFPSSILLKKLNKKALVYVNSYTLINTTIRINGIEDEFKPSGLFNFTKVKISKDIAILTKNPSILIDIKVLKPEDILNLVDAGALKYVVIVAENAVDTSNLKKFIKLFSSEASYKGKATVYTPLVLQIDENNVMIYFTIGTYYMISGETRYLFFAALSIFLLLFSTILGTVYERSKEYSILACLGASPRTIYLVMFLEGAYLASLGGVLSMFIAYPIIKEGISAYYKSNLPSVFFLSLGTSYLATIASYLALRIKGIREVTPSRVVKYTAERKKTGGEFEVPIKIHDWNNFKRFLKEIEGKHVEPGIKILKVSEENGKLKALVACGIEREALYIFTFTHTGETVKIKVTGEKTWTAEHSRLYDLAVRSFRKLALMYTLKRKAETK